MENGMRVAIETLGDQIASLKSTMDYYKRKHEEYQKLYEQKVMESIDLKKKASSIEEENTKLKAEVESLKGVVDLVRTLEEAGYNMTTLVSDLIQNPAFCQAINNPANMPDNILDSLGVKMESENQKRRPL